MSRLTSVAAAGALAAAVAVVVSAPPATATHEAFRANVFRYDLPRNLVWDVPYANAFAGADVWQYGANYSIAQEWRFVHRYTNPSGVRYYSIHPAANLRLCLDIGGWSKDDFGRVLLWHCHYGANQLFKFSWLGAFGITNLHSGKCIDVLYGSREWRVKLQQYTCNGTTAQRWYIDKF